MFRLLRELLQIYRTLGLQVSVAYLYRLVTRLPTVLATKSLRSVDELMNSDFYAYRVGAGKLLLPGHAFGLAREIIGRSIYEFDDRFKIARGDRVLDLGANIGVFSLFAGAHGAEVIAVEGQAGFSKEFQHLVQKNGLGQIKLLNGLVGVGTGVFSEDSERQNSPDWTEDVDELGIDQILEAASWDTVDFLKVDIEGSEFDLLMNEDLSWLSSIRRIAMEVHTEYGDVTALVRKLSDSGFDVVVTDLNKNRRGQLDEEYGFIYACRQDH